jgi:diacylglycerol O-acyltransferase / wax synthase
MVLFEGTDPSRLAWLIKLHHAVADGLGAIAAGSAFTDLEPTRPDGLEIRREAAVPGRNRSPKVPWATVVRNELAPIAQSMTRTAAALRSDHRRAMGAAGRVMTGLVELARDGPAPPSPLNRPVGRARSFRVAAMSMEDVLLIREAFSCGLNDLVLTVVGAGLRQWFLRRGIVPPASIRAVSPISLRTKVRSDRPGNWTVGLSAPLPMGDLRPEARLRAIHASVSHVQGSCRPDGAQFAMHALGTCLPAPVHARAARRMYHGGWFNVIITAMRGSPVPLFLAGARIVTAFPILPLAPNVGLTVGAMTWGGELTLGFTADPAIVPDIDHLVRDVEATANALVEAARSSRESGPRAGSASGDGSTPVLVPDERVEPDRPEPSIA